MTIFNPLRMRWGQIPSDSVAAVTVFGGFNPNLEPGLSLNLTRLDHAINISSTKASCGLVLVPKLAQTTFKGVCLPRPVFVVDTPPTHSSTRHLDPFYDHEQASRLCARFIPHLFARPEYAPSSTNYPTSFPTPSITRSCIPSSPPSPPSSYLHPQHYRSRLLHHCFCTWYPLTPTFPQSRMS